MYECVRACMRACVRACLRACVQLLLFCVVNVCKKLELKKRREKLLFLGHNQSFVQKQITLGTLVRDGVERIGAFLSALILYPQLN